jgi:methanogenic corrinoid protein MtbC1
LKDASESGYRIGRVSVLEDEELRTIIAAARSRAIQSGGAQIRQEERPAAVSVGSSGESLTELIEAAVEAAGEYDARRLESVIQHAVSVFGSVGIDENFVFPFLHELQRRTVEGQLGSAHQHLAANCLRAYFEQRLRTEVSPDSAPTLVVGTMLGEHYEIGALAAACQAEHSGWRTVYLGADSSAEAIADAAGATEARAVIVALVVERFGAATREELRRLRQFLPDEVPIMVGGAYIEEIEDDLQQIGLTVLQSMSHLRSELTEGRSGTLQPTP